MIRSAFIQSMAALLALLVLTSCSDGGSGQVRFESAPKALEAAQKALEDGGGYRLRVEQSNLVMPQWGGSDSGVITVNSEGSVAKAELKRTGEPSALYEIMLVEGQTFFKRSTCNETFRISGGGATVLRPYLFAKTKALAGAKDARYEGNLLYATLDGLGPVTIELNNQTARPMQIRGTSNGRDLIWTFEAWGTKPDVAKPKSARDQGPGGNPC